MSTAIVVCTDSGYIEQTAVLFQSFADNYYYRKDIDLICVMPEDSASGFDRLPDLLNLDLRFNLKLVKASNKDFGWLSNLKIGDKSIPPALWYRCFLGSLLPEYERAIYLDPDTLIVKDVQPLLDYPMHGALLATYDTVGVPWLYNLDSKNSLAHFVSGVLIMDLDWWRSSGVEGLMKDELLSDGPHDLLDEYLLNKYVKDQWYPLPPTFNFHSYMEDLHGVPDWDSTYLPTSFYENAIVFHFSGQIKPWNMEEIAQKSDTSKLGSLWRERHRLALDTSQTVKTITPSRLIIERDK